MELDEMKLAWQMLDRRLEQQHVLNVQIFRDSRLDKMRRGLRPLVWGQAFQIVVGVIGLMLFAPIWIADRDNLAVLLSGLVLHLYFVGLIVVGAVIQAQIARIDYAAPVILIQRQLLQLRKTYVHYGALICGLPWWFLTAPLLVVLSRGAIMVNAPSAIWAQLVVGVVGLLATWWFYRWSHRPEREQLGRKLDDSNAGGSIRRAQTIADELARFEQE
ncbi:MAG: hypothetical protein WA777_14410 [Rhodanobacter sp.]